jgi:biotin carboxyl carrier protein
VLEELTLVQDSRLLLTTDAHSMLYEDQDRIGTSKKKEGLDVTEVNAPMAGKVIDVKVKVGDTVSENDEVVILEAMKMELPIVATGSGTVKEIRCKKGDPVEADAVLIVLG